MEILMKNKWLVLITVLFASMSLTGCSKDSSGRTSIEKNLVYTYDEETDGYAVSCSGVKTEALLTKYKVTIPETYKGNKGKKPVTKIAKSGFENISPLETVSLPESIVSIEESAFAGCKSLILINLPSKLTKISAYSFNNTAIYKITIPEGVTSIGDCAFKINHLKELHIPANVQTIGYAAFSYSTYLYKITVDENNPYFESRDSNAIVEKENNRVILGCKRTTFPESVTTIGTNAFYGVRFVTDDVVVPLRIPTNIVCIEKNAFRNCEHLTIYCGFDEKPDGWDDEWHDDTYMTIYYNGNWPSHN